MNAPTITALLVAWLAINVAFAVFGTIRAFNRGWRPGVGRRVAQHGGEQQSDLDQFNHNGSNAR